MTYYKRNIDKKLLEWKASQRRKPLLIRGASQVGKSSALRHVEVIPLYELSNL